MSKLEEKVADLMAYSKKHKIKGIDEKMLTKVCKALGPSLYKADSAKVACGQKSELETIAKGHCKKKLGLKDDKKIMEGIMDVCKEMGMSNRNKQRAIFYYLLAKRFRKSGVYK
jgi:hypothetical protein